MQFATAKIGAILITVNTNYREHELRYLLTHSECENIFLIDSVRDHDYLGHALPHWRLSCVCVARQVCVQKPAAPQARVLSGGGKAPGMYSVPEILALSVMVDEAEYAARQALLQPWDVINMQYTSGTTGFPRGVMLTHVGVGLNGYWIVATRISARKTGCVCRCRCSTASAACLASPPQ